MEALRSFPAIAGAKELPADRAIEVTPPAAERSPASTTAIVYACRVGTSICEMLKRISSMAIASGKVGISGTSISKTLDGICVNTIVLMSPILRASRVAERAESPARTFPKKNIAPNAAG